MYKNGDVVINYRRSRVYLYDEKNKQHLKDFFSCRIASLQEKQDFLKLKVQQCKLRDLNIKREWKNRQKINVTIIISPITVKQLNRIGEQLNFNNYEDIISYLLQNINGNINQNENELELELENKNKFLEKLNQLITIELKK